MELRAFGHPSSPSEVGSTALSSLVRKWSFWSDLRHYFDPALMVSVAYVDLGNYGTDIGGGASFGYSMLWVVWLAGIMAMLLQFARNTGSDDRAGLSDARTALWPCRCSGIWRYPASLRNIFLDNRNDRRIGNYGGYLGRKSNLWVRSIVTRVINIVPTTIAILMVTSSCRLMPLHSSFNMSQ
jgi:hypothetical protein